jgi:hypothetical protein
LANLGEPWRTLANLGEPWRTLANLGEPWRTLANLGERSKPEPEPDVAKIFVILVRTIFLLQDMLIDVEYNISSLLNQLIHKAIHEEIVLEKCL